MSFYKISSAQTSTMHGRLFVLVTLIITILAFTATGMLEQTLFSPALLLAISTLCLFGVLKIGRSWLLRILAQPVIPKRIFGIAILVLIAATTLYTEFDGLLYGFHQPGEIASGINAATSLGTFPGRRGREMCQAVQSWKNFMRPQNSVQRRAPNNPCTDAPPPIDCTPQFRSCLAPLTVLTWALLVDSVALVPAYGLILGLLVVWGGTMRANLQRQTQPFRRWQPNAVLWFLAIAVGADWLENAMTLGAFVNGWRAPTTIPGLGLYLLSFITGFKWLGIFLVVIYLLGEAWLYTQTPVAVAQVAKTIMALRVPMLLVLVFYATLLVHEQVPDIMRRMADPSAASIGVGIIMLVVTLLFAISIWYSSRWMLTAPAQDDGAEFAMWLRRLNRLGALLCVVLVALGSWKPLLPFALALLFWALTQFPNWLVNLWEQSVGRLWRGLLRWWGQWVVRLWRALFKTQQPASRADAQIASVQPQTQTTDTTQKNSQQPDEAPLTPQATQMIQQLDRHGPRLLGCAVLVILAITLLKSTAGLILYNHLRGLPVLRYYGLLGAAFVLLSGTVFICGALRDDTMKEYRARLIPTRWRTISWILVGGVGGWIVLIVWWVVSPNALYAVAPRIGPIGMLSFNLLLINLILCAVIAVANRASQRQTKMARLPVLTMLGLWFVLASVLPPHETLHDVLARPNTAQPNAAMQGQDITQLFDHWRCRNRILPTNSGSKVNCPPELTLKTDEVPKAIPLILIATAGGGIRAAVWTAYVLDRAIGYDAIDDTNATAVPPVNRVFAISSVSGGSLGVANYMARLHSPPPVKQDSVTVSMTVESSPPLAPCTEANSQSDEHWVCAHLGRDVISPVLSWLTFVEVPWSLLRFDLDWPFAARDRARILEESWERAWPQVQAEGGSALAVDLFKLATMPDTAQAHVPLLVFNGTTVEGGCRMNTSILKSSSRGLNDPVKGCLDLTSPKPVTTSAPPQRVLAATVDLVDFLCQNDVLPLSTAVLLSARFPLISPSGHITQCPVAQTETVTATGGLESYVVDGGYLENSGAGTALELWLALEPLVEQHNKNSEFPPIIPFFIQIDNGYAEPATPGSIPSQLQLLVPLRALGATLNGHEAMARQVAAGVFNRKYTVAEAQCFKGIRYAHFIPQAHPGAQAPLGWVLSQESFYDLSNQFVYGKMNQQAQRDVARWFNPIALDKC